VAWYKSRYWVRKCSWLFHTMFAQPFSVHKCIVCAHLAMLAPYRLSHFLDQCLIPNKIHWSLILICVTLFLESTSFCRVCHDQFPSYSSYFPDAITQFSLFSIHSRLTTIFLQIPPTIGTDWTAFTDFWALVCFIRFPAVVDSYFFISFLGRIIEHIPCIIVLYCLHFLISLFTPLFELFLCGLFPDFKLSQLSFARWCSYEYMW